MRSYLLAIDIGTSAAKLAVFNRDGQVIDTQNCPYQVYYQKPGWAEQNPEEWWASIAAGLKALWEKQNVRPEEIAGIGIDGQGWSAIAIDREGNCLTNTPIWMDTRAIAQCDAMNEKIGADAIFELAGNALLPSYTTPKIFWYQEHMPEVIEKTDKILQSNGYLAYKLTGCVSQDLSQGYGWHCFDMRTGSWDLGMARAMGIPEHFLPPICSCDTIVGTVTKEAAEATGLKEGTPVTAGGLDAAAGTLGAGVLHDGETQEQGGQAGGMSICIENYKADPRLILGYHVMPGKWLLQGGTTGGGGVMRWFEKEFAGYERLMKTETGKGSLQQLNEIAEKVAPGCDGMVFLPYMSGERSPIWDVNAKGVFYGIDFSKTRGHFVRACMEGVAYALKHNLDVAEEAGAPVNVLRAVGGSANSLLWTQIKADVTGKEIIVPYSDEATTLGAALLAGVGTGMYADYEEAVGLTVKTTRAHTPNEEMRSAYNTAYQSYRSLYENLKDQMTGK